jgi:hypothetical protein
MKVIVAFILLIFISLWSAVEIGSGNLQVGLGVLALSIFLIVVVMLGRKLPLDLVAMIACVGGYIALGKGFAYLNAGSVFFVGELLLLLLGLFYLGRAFTRQISFIPKDKMGFYMLLLMLLGGIRTFWDFRSYGVMAVRDYCILYYCFVFFCSYGIFKKNPNFRAKAYKWMVPWYVLGLLGVITSYYIPFIHKALQKITIKGNILYMPHEASGYSAVAIGLYLLYYIKKFTQQSSFITSILGYIAILLAVLTSRGATILAFLILCFILVLANQWKKMIPIVLVGLFGFSSVLIYADFSNKKIEVVDKVVEEVTSWNVLSESADTRSNASWRWFWWSKIVRDVTNENPFFGLGFGRDISQEFEDDFYGIHEGAQRGSRTRGAHSALFTILARAGYAGAILFLIVIWYQLKYFWKAILLMRANKFNADLAGALGFVTMGFVVTFVQYTWDASYSAIPFWFICGLFYADLDDRLPDGMSIQAVVDRDNLENEYDQLTPGRSQTFAH